MSGLSLILLSLIYNLVRAISINILRTAAVFSEPIYNSDKTILTDLTGICFPYKFRLILIVSDTI